MADDDLRRQALSGRLDRLVAQALIHRNRVLVPLQHLRTRSTRQSLHRRKPDQRGRFNRLRPRFAEIREALSSSDEPSFSTPAWAEYATRLDAQLADDLQFHFLDDPLVRFTMVVNRRGRSLKDGTALVRDHFGPRASELLEEDPVGGPPLVGRDPPTSPNTIRHLYDLARFERATGMDVGALPTVVEWGGGYGNQAKLVRRLIGPHATQIVLDLPISGALQWIYLSSIFGESSVRVVTAPEQGLEEGRINIVPVGLASTLDITPDLFISTWALSECSHAAQDFVADRDWFGAAHLLLGYQHSSFDFPEAERLGRLAQSRGAAAEDVGHAPGGWYAFA